MKIHTKTKHSMTRLPRFLIKTPTRETKEHSGDENNSASEDDIISDEEEMDRGNKNMCNNKYVRTIKMSKM